MKITKQWGIDRNVCSLGLDWFDKNKETDGIKIIERLISEDKFKWAIWVLVRFMNYNEYSSCIVYSLEKIIGYEEYPKEILSLINDYLNFPTPGKKEAIERKINDILDESYIQKAILFATKAIIYNDCQDAYTSILWASIAYTKYNYKYDIPVDNKMQINTDHNDIFIDTPYNAIKKKIILQILNYGLDLLKQKSG